MAKRTFEEKEKAFLANNKTSLQETFGSAYVPQKRKQDKAIEILREAGLNVLFKDSIVYCECENDEEYARYEALLLKHFGEDGKVAFSFGATIKKHSSPEYLEEK